MSTGLAITIGLIIYTILCIISLGIMLKENIELRIKNDELKEEVEKWKHCHEQLTKDFHRFRSSYGEA